MEVDLSFVPEFEDIINTSTRSIESSYDCAWNDSVHESFGSFISSYRLESNGITAIIDSFERTCKTLEGVDGNKLMQEVGDLIAGVE